MTRRLMVMKWAPDGDSPHKKWRIADDYEATFCAFSTDYEELEAGIGTFPCVVFEKKDGTVDSRPLKLIRFLE